MTAKLALDLYAKISAISSQMLAAAQDQDWDLLCELEESCSAYTEKLKSLETDGMANEFLSNKKIHYIKAILENDRQIREIVSPWMKKLNGLIMHSQTEKKLNKAYYS